MKKDSKYIIIIVIIFLALVIPTTEIIEPFFATKEDKNKKNYDFSS